MANIERSIMRLMRITNHPLEVVSVRDFTPLYRRIRFHSPELVGALDVSPTLSSHPQLEAAWVVPAVRDHGGELAAWMRRLDVDPADLWVWGAGERGLVKAVRSVCKDVWRLDRARYFTQAYWMKGKAGR